MFNGIWLVATEPLTIQGRDVQAGERFHISRVHSGALLVQGRATILRPQPPSKSSAAPEPPAAPVERRKPGRPRKTVNPETPKTPVTPEPEKAPEAPRQPEPQPVPETPETPQTPAVGETPDDDEPIVIPRRRYQRRDLEAE